MAPGSGGAGTGTGTSSGIVSLRRGVRVCAEGRGWKAKVSPLGICGLVPFLCAFRPAVAHFHHLLLFPRDHPRRWRGMTNPPPPPHACAIGAVALRGGGPLRLARRTDFRRQLLGTASKIRYTETWEGHRTLFPEHAWAGSDGPSDIFP